MALSDVIAAVAELRHRSSSAALAYVSFFTSIAAPILHFWVIGDVARAKIATAFGLATAILALRAIPRRHRPLHPLSVFAGVRPLQSRQVWRRPELAAKVMTRVRGAKGEPVFFAGRSGSGKSTLFEHEIIPELSGWSTAVISQYDVPPVVLSKALGNRFGAQAIKDLQFPVDDLATDENPLLILFDQLERISHEPPLTQEWVRLFIGYVLANKNVRVVGVVRQEYLYALRRLGPAVPQPYYLEEIPALEEGLDTEAMASLTAALHRVADAAVVAHLLPSDEKQKRERGWPALPVEMQMIGEVLEREARETGRVDERTYTRLGGDRRALLGRYFENYVAAAPNAELARAAIFALSVAAPPRTLSLAELANATFTTSSRIQPIVDLLVEQRLVCGEEEDRLQLRHDALATQYHELAALRLPAGVREAVTHRVNQYGQVVRPPWQASVHIALSTLVFVVMVLGVAVNVGWEVNDSTTLINYAIVAPAHVAWAFFMYRLATRFFVRLPGYAAWLWFFLAAAGSFSLVWTARQPESWIAAMGLTGLALGIAFWIVALQRLLSDVARREFRTVGNNFVIVALAMCLAGWAFIVVTQTCGGLADELPPATLVMSLSFVLLSLTSTNKYATDAAATAWMGLVDRA